MNWKFIESKVQDAILWGIVIGLISAPILAFFPIDNSFASKPVALQFTLALIATSLCCVMVAGSLSNGKYDFEGGIALGQTVLLTASGIVLALPFWQIALYLTGTLLIIALIGAVTVWLGRFAGRLFPRRARVR